ncbi:MAG: glycosyltransferase [Prevotella sp.]|nr:glycosyltransferase [Prevotella sp.]
MIFARDKSQMCNNLLQFAHVYAWAREHNRSVMSMRFSYKYRFFKISHSKYANFPLYLFAKYMAALKLLPTASFKRITCDAPALEKMMLCHKHIVVSGWFVRFYDLFEKYKDEIRDLFTILPEYTEPVRERMKESKDTLRLGVHIRRGDYAYWANGRFLYDDEVYKDHIAKFASFFPDKEIHIYLSTNDPEVSPANFNVQNVHVHQMKENNAVQDLFMLSECDYIIGPPSTFSLVASMYRDIPFYRMDTKDVENFSLDAFNTFNYWFRRINEL